MPVAPAFGEAKKDGELGIVAGGEMQEAGRSQEAGSSVVPVAPAFGEAEEDGELGIVAGGEMLAFGTGGTPAR